MTEHTTATPARALSEIPGKPPPGCIRRPHVSPATGYSLDGCRCPECSEAQREYMARYRADPLAADTHRWSTRTARAAQMELARRHPGEYAAILYEVRETDPKPAATEESNAA